MVVYLDVLIILNFYIIYFLLRAVCILTHQKIKTSRILAGSALGSLTSLIILLPSLSIPLLIIIKSFCGAFIIFIAFGFSNIKAFLKQLIFFMIINFIVAGITTMIQQNISDKRFITINGIIYVDISITMIVISTIVAYFAVKIITYIIDFKANSTTKYSVTIKTETGEKTLKAISDTGNSLVDIYTGKPIIICSNKILDISPSGIFDYFNKDEINAINKGIKLIPANSIGGRSIIPAFMPEKIIIKSDFESKAVDALIGVTESDTLNNEYQCIFNPILIR
ncbi:MAG: sigma-E processing peptidase SpoIIGA [Clostridiales bacterium]|nr:sigma-E processing peptidase SpoIIGA [Clostridiales bacterium]